MFFKSLIVPRSQSAESYLKTRTLGSKLRERGRRGPITLRCLRTPKNDYINPCNEKYVHRPLQREDTAP